MNTDRIRQLYLDFFEGKGHQVLPSATLVPANDPTLLLTSAGMVPFKSYFLGTEKAPYGRITTCQRCIRTGDIENVGQTDRHHTFFEMLGNFSFGDYFKREAIAYAWEFTVDHLGFPADKIWVTIYTDDDESFDLWHREIGLPKERIVRLGKEDNFWEIGVGPCGPCSELHYDRGPEYGCGAPDCAPGCDDCERYLEFWNLVFIQFHQDEEGQLTPLKSKGIDTGMGLERVAALLQGVDSNFDTDIIIPLIRRVSALAAVPYGKNADYDKSMRVIADHVRAVTFMVFDGIVPGNEGRSYVLRRLIRRAIRYGHLLGMDKPFLADLIDLTIELMSTGYPDIVSAKDRIKQVITVEETRFRETITQGVRLLDELITGLKKAGRTVLPGQDVFRLYDTYGFPPELTAEILKAEGLEPDLAAFEEEMQAQRERARQARGTQGYLGDEEAIYTDIAEELGATTFVGYDTLTTPTKITGIIVGDERKDIYAHGDEDELIDVFLEKSSFYAESGGQVADRGVITADGVRFEVEDVQKVAGDCIVHRGRLVTGTLKVDMAVEAAVNATDRRRTERNHTATHLLHQALKDRLGDHVKQAGSLVAPDRLRFDFTHFEGLTPDDLAAIEESVNEKILENLPVVTDHKSYDEAIASGAVALFGEKYRDIVRVVDIGGYSVELCGGTHVKSSAEVGLFKLTAENGIASGVRRIEAVTGDGFLEYSAARDATLASAAALVDSRPNALVDHLSKFVEKMKAMEKEVSGLKAKLALAEVDRLIDSRVVVDDVNVIVSRVDGVDAGDLRAMGDAIIQKLDKVLIVLGSPKDTSIQLVAMADPLAVDQGIKANDVIRHVAKIVKGGGGGSPRMAQAGGKDASAFDRVAQETESFVRQVVQAS